MGNGTPIKQERRKEGDEEMQIDIILKFCKKNQQHNYNSSCYQLYKLLIVLILLLCGVDTR